MNKVIVTGGAGYIGSHTCLKLIELGYEPLIIDNLSNTSIENIKGVESITNKKLNFYELDCCSAQNLDMIIKKENGIIGAIHFAAYKSVEESVREPEKYFKNNLKSLESLIDVMLNQNLNNLIFSSSCTVYGSPDSLPVDENAPFKKAESPYGETKQLCEKIIEKSTLFSVCLRYFNPIGSHNSGLIGDRSADKPANLVPIICEVACGKREKLIINGNDYNTKDGTCIRDFIHVKDLGDAHLLSFKKLLSFKVNKFINVGGGKGFSIYEIIESIKKVTNMQLLTTVVKRRDGDPDILISNIDNAKKLLGWQPKYSDIELIISDSWKWHQNYFP